MGHTSFVFICIHDSIWKPRWRSLICAEPVLSFPLNTRLPVIDRSCCFKFSRGRCYCLMSAGLALDSFFLALCLFYLGLS